MSHRGSTRLRTFGRAAPLGVAVVLALTACGSANLTEVGDPTGPLTALPPCDDPPTEVVDDAAAVLVLPDDAVILTMTDQDPLVSAAGYVELTPIQVRRAYEAMHDIDLHVSEDEVFESEMLFATDGFRTFVRATAACDRGSHLMAVVAPDTDDAGLPAPRGDGTTTDG